MRKLVLAFLALFVVGVVGTLVSVSASGGFSLETYNINDKRVIINKEISNLEINLSSTDVTVHPTTEEHITVQMNGKMNKKLKNKLKLDVHERGQTLIVELQREDQIKLNIGVIIMDTNIDIYLPSKLYSSIIINTSSGDITLNQLKAEKVKLEASSGDILANNLVSNDHYYQTSSGEMELKNIAGDMTLMSSSGDIILSNYNLTGNINAKASSGDITIEILSEPRSLKLDYHGSSGEGIVALEGIKYEEKTKNKIKGTIGSGDIMLIVETSSGDFYLK